MNLRMQHALFCYSYRWAVIDLDIGRTNKRITFCRYKEDFNDLHQLVQVIEKVRTVWASVEPKKGTDNTEADKVRSELTYVITTRYFKDVTQDMFIQFKNRLFEIDSVRNIREANEMLEILCTEKFYERKDVHENGKF